jgi:hypothetical protein
MKFIFNSESYGTTVEIIFEATHIDQIRDMFDQFLRGSGFHFPDVDEEIYATADESEISVTADELREEIKRMQKLINKPWVGLSDQEVAIYSSVYGGSRLVSEVEAQLKERNT